MPLPRGPEEIKGSLTAGDPAPCFQLILKPGSVVYSLGKTGDHPPGPHEAALLRDAAGPGTAWPGTGAPTPGGQDTSTAKIDPQQDHGLGDHCPNPVSCQAGTVPSLTGSEQKPDLGNDSNLQPGLWAR